MKLKKIKVIKKNYGKKNQFRLTQLTCHSWHDINITHQINWHSICFFYLLCTMFSLSHDPDHGSYMLTWVDPGRSNMLSYPKKIKRCYLEKKFSQTIFFSSCLSYLWTYQVVQIILDQSLHDLFLFILENMLAMSKYYF
jgi:hypothetical protein